MRLDENESGETIKVADGVCFIATANIGNEYTATRVIDKALARRFPIKLEMPPLTGPELIKLFGMLFTSALEINEKKMMVTLSKISDDLIEQCKLEDAPISTFISAANMVEMAELILDGFSLEEIAESAIYPEYPDEGGADSEQAFVRQIIQRYVPNNFSSPINDPVKK